jgi:hypothetical protein
MRIQPVPGVAMLGCLLASVAEAQAVVRGQVLEDSTRTPLPDVEIMVQNRGAFRTDASGHFMLGELPKGVHVLLFRRIGFRPFRLRAILTEGDTLDRVIVMTRAAVELPPLEITASAVPPGMERFAERRAAGRGTFFDWNVLRQSEHRRLPDLLSRVPGVRPVNYTDPRSMRQKAVMATRRGGSGLTKSQCFMAVWLDGVKIFEPTSGSGGSPRVDPPDITHYLIRDLEAIEVYEGPASLPPELSGTGGNCGAVVMWSRRR